MKKTFQPNVRRKHKKHGFLTRMKTENGQKVIQRRRERGRVKLAVV